MDSRQICLLSVVVCLTWAALFAKDTEWPLVIETPKGKITVYQLQPDAFVQDILDARAAASFIPSGQTTPRFGAVWLTTRLQVDREARRSGSPPRAQNKWHRSNPPSKPQHKAE
jgi:hypothetical protein